MDFKKCFAIVMALLALCSGAILALAQTNPTNPHSVLGFYRNGDLTMVIGYSAGNDALQLPLGCPIQLNNGFLLKIRMQISILLQGFIS